MRTLKKQLPSNDRRQFPIMTTVTRLLVVLVLTLLLWVKQYRTTRQRTGLYPVDTFGGAGGESKARPFEVYGYAFAAHKPISGS